MVLVTLLGTAFAECDAAAFGVAALGEPNLFALGVLAFGVATLIFVVPLFSGDTTVACFGATLDLRL